jgi:hypothetical protein
MMLPHEYLITVVGQTAALGQPFPCDAASIHPLLRAVLSDTCDRMMFE